MSDAYKKAKAGRLPPQAEEAQEEEQEARLRCPSRRRCRGRGRGGGAEGGGGSGAGDDYTIDAAKKMKYEQLFPVEAKKFGYDPANAARNRTVEEALDDRVRKKADRYCK